MKHWNFSSLCAPQVLALIEPNWNARRVERKIIFSSSGVVLLLKFIFGHALFFRSLLLSRACVNVFPNPRIFRRDDKMHFALPICLAMTFQLLNNRVNSQFNSALERRAHSFNIQFQLNIRQVFAPRSNNTKQRKCFVKNCSNVSNGLSIKFPPYLNKWIVYSLFL